MSTSTERFSSENLDYLQRTGPRFVPTRLATGNKLLTSVRHLVQVCGVGRLAKTSAPDRRQTALSDWELTQLVSQDLLIGLYGYGLPIAFLVVGDPGGVQLHMGLWDTSPVEPHSSDHTQVLRAILDGVYPGIDLSGPVDAGGLASRPWTLAGLVLGIPTAKPPDATDGAYAIDRVIRSMGDTAWQALILAQPLPESAIRSIRGEVIAEMRSVQSSTAGGGTPSPLAEHYNRLLEIALDELTHAQAVGGWRTAVYLLGTKESYHRLTGVWRSIFSGGGSLPEPIRVWQFPDALGLAEAWAMPDLPEERGPGFYNHPYRYQTILSSSQLAAYVHLPQLETRGFTVKVVPEFDVVPEPVTAPSAICVGNVVERTRSTKAAYSVPTTSLSGHVFVTGMTGSGKTNTLFHLLREAFAKKVPFLVIEPAKTEYRALLNDPTLGPDLRVFTAGDENTAPLRLNPFEIQPNVSLSVHLDLLRSVFSTSFGMWVPLPQVLEKCLVGIYEDWGWDIARGENLRVGSGMWDPYAFPTLSDLVAKVEEVVPGLGFDPEATARILASLTARINGLRSGGKGRMLDVQESFPVDELFQHPTVLELEAIGDDDDKAFIIGLLFIRLVEYRRLHGPGELQHLLVIEEAHRLLTNVARNPDREQSDPRGKAVETFTSLLSEIRAYGQGVMIADQVPTRLAPDVIKNTNLKITHRIVAGDDREALGKAMAMSDRQIAAMSNLRKGQAVVFSGESDDAPLLIEIDHVKGKAANSVAANAVRKKMNEVYLTIPSFQLFSQTRACKESCSNSEAPVECKTAKALLEVAMCRAALSRLALSIIENASTAEPLWSDVRAFIRSSMPPSSDEQRLNRCFAVRGAAWLANRRGTQAGWSYHDTRRFEGALRKVLLSLLGEGDKTRTLRHFQDCALDLHTRHYPPYRSCAAICAQRQPPVCLYRFAAADLLSAADLKRRVASVLASDGPLEPRGVWYEALKAAWRLVALGNEAAEEESKSTEASSIRAGLCFVQQAIEGEPGLHPRNADLLLDTLLEMSRQPPVPLADDANGSQSKGRSK